MKTQQVWFVTGASKGLGLSLVKQLLQQGHKVAATSRKLEDLAKAVGSHTDFLPLAVDLKTEASVQKSIEQTVAQFGRIDVVVNNAGYGMVGSLEELSDEEARDNFDVNVFGMLNVIRQTMPYLRKQRSGHILNISSVGGFVGAFAGWGIYCATKFAVVGLSEALAEEVREFGVNVTAVLPGYFRTEFLASGSIVVPKQEIADYTQARASQNAHQQTINGNQAGDPEKAVQAMIQIAASAHPPIHLFLGQDAYNFAYQKMDVLQKTLEEWKEVSISTDFDQPATV